MKNKFERLQKKNVDPINVWLLQGRTLKYRFICYLKVVGKKIKEKKGLYNRLLKKAFPASLAAAAVTLAALGVLRTNELLKVKNYSEWDRAHQKKVQVTEIVDGDTFRVSDGRSVRLLSTNAPDSGEANFQLAKQTLTELIDQKQIYLEYDRYQDDKFNRILAWVWVGCESNPLFKKYDYMVVSQTRSKAEGLNENPKGCLKGKLVNEEMIKFKMAVAEPPEDRGKLKYEDRIKN